GSVTAPPSAPGARVGPEARRHPPAEGALVITRSASSANILQGAQPIELERETGFEPATLSLGKVSGPVAGVPNASEVAANARLEPAWSIRRVSSLAGFGQGCGSQLTR